MKVGELSTTAINIPWKDSILDTVRERPGMYLGLKSLSALRYFLKGYEMGRLRSDCEVPLAVVPTRFADWVAYRLHLSSNWSGFWHCAILSRVRDEAMALDRFYQLLDEFARREAKVVATIREDCREYKVGRMGADGQIVDCIEQLPRSLRIVVYTEDPGFFFEVDESEPFSYAGWFMAALDGGYMTNPDRFEVVDRTTWTRLLAESKRYRRNLNRVRARIQKKQRDAQIHP